MDNLPEWRVNFPLHQAIHILSELDSNVFLEPTIGSWLAVTNDVHYFTIATRGKYDAFIFNCVHDCGKLSYVGNKLTVTAKQSALDDFFGYTTKSGQISSRWIGYYYKSAMEYVYNHMLQRTIEYYESGEFKGLIYASNPNSMNTARDIRKITGHKGAMDRTSPKPLRIGPHPKRRKTITLKDYKILIRKLEASAAESPNFKYTIDELLKMKHNG